jgi:hypothetical protein
MTVMDRSAQHVGLPLLPLLLLPLLLLLLLQF